MKVTGLNNSHNFCGKGAFINKAQNFAAKNFAKIDEIGEATNIALDFSGKAILVPLIIMMTSKEEKETKEYSALKNPVAATIQLAIEAPLLAIGSKIISTLANKGALDKRGSDYSYNEKASLDRFVSQLKAQEGDEQFGKKIGELRERLETSGLNRQIKEEFDEFLEKSALAVDNKKVLKGSLDNLQTTQKRLYHLQNRVCFAAALILTPVLCKIEDYLHPKIMNKIKKPKAEKLNITVSKPISPSVSMQEFIKKVKNINNESGVQ